MIIYRRSFNINKALLAVVKDWPRQPAPDDVIRQAMIETWQTLIAQFISESEHYQPWQVGMPDSGRLVFWAEPDGFDVVCHMALIPWEMTIPAHIERGLLALPGAD